MLPRPVSDVALASMPHTLTRFVAVVLLLVQGLASLGRGESLCIPLATCGEAVAAHRHDHGPHAGRAFVAHQHGSGEHAFAVEQVHHACDHDHGHASASGEHRFDEPCDHEICCGDHLHFNLSDHDLPPRSGSAADLLVLAIDLPATTANAIVVRGESVPRDAMVGQAWIRSDQRRTIDVASIVV